jgi:hypothetical protein
MHPLAQLNQRAFRLPRWVKAETWRKFVPTLHSKFDEFAVWYKEMITKEY